MEFMAPNLTPSPADSNGRSDYSSRPRGSPLSPLEETLSIKVPGRKVSDHDAATYGSTLDAAHSGDGSYAEEMNNVFKPSGSGVCKKLLLPTAFVSCLVLLVHITGGMNAVMSSNLIPSVGVDWMQKLQQHGKTAMESFAQMASDGVVINIYGSKVSGAGAADALTERNLLIQQLIPKYLAGAEALSDPAVVNSKPVIVFVETFVKTGNAEYALPEFTNPSSKETSDYSAIKSGQPGGFSEALFVKNMELQKKEAQKKGIDLQVFKDEEFEGCTQGEKSKKESKDIGWEAVKSEEAKLTCCEDTTCVPYLLVFTFPNAQAEKDWNESPGKPAPVYDAHRKLVSDLTETFASSKGLSEWRQMKGMRETKGVDSVECYGSKLTGCGKPESILKFPQVIVKQKPGTVMTIVDTYVKSGKVEFPERVTEMQKEAKDWNIDMRLFEAPCKTAANDEFATTFGLPDPLGQDEIVKANKAYEAGGGQGADGSEKFYDPQTTFLCSTSKPYYIVMTFPDEETERRWNSRSKPPASVKAWREFKGEKATPKDSIKCYVDETGSPATNPFYNSKKKALDACKHESSPLFAPQITKRYAGPIVAVWETYVLNDHKKKFETIMKETRVEANGYGIDWHVFDGFCKDKFAFSDPPECCRAGTCSAHQIVARFPNERVEKIWGDRTDAVQVVNDWRDFKGPGCYFDENGGPPGDGKANNAYYKSYTEGLKACKGFGDAGKVGAPQLLVRGKAIGHWPAIPNGPKRAGHLIRYDIDTTDPGAAKIAEDLLKMVAQKTREEGKLVHAGLLEEGTCWSKSHKGRLPEGAGIDGKLQFPAQASYPNCKSMYILMTWPDEASAAIGPMQKAHDAELFNLFFREQKGKFLNAKPAKDVYGESLPEGVTAETRLFTTESNVRVMANQEIEGTTKMVFTWSESGCNQDADSLRFKVTAPDLLQKFEDSGSKSTSFAWKQSKGEVGCFEYYDTFASSKVAGSYTFLPEDAEASEDKLQDQLFLDVRFEYIDKPEWVEPEMTWMDEATDENLDKLFYNGQAQTTVELPLGIQKNTPMTFAGPGSKLGGKLGAFVYKIGDERFVRAIIVGGGVQK